MLPGCSGNFNTNGKEKQRGCASRASTSFPGNMKISSEDPTTPTFSAVRQWDMQLTTAYSYQNIWGTLPTKTSDSTQVSFNCFCQLLNVTLSYTPKSTRIKVFLPPLWLNRASKCWGKNAVSIFLKLVRLRRANPMQGFCCHNASFRWEAFITLFPTEARGGKQTERKMVCSLETINLWWLTAALLHLPPLCPSSAEPRHPG